jgi:adenylyl-sulfate kinase
MSGPPDGASRAVGDRAGAGAGGGLRTVPGAPTVWFTGLSGAGKTTIAQALARQLEQRGVAHGVLDGDELRATLSADLGFSRDDRAEQVRRVGHLARILGDAGVIPLVALVSPFRADRDAVRALHAPGRFLEIHVATSLEVCAQRDVKGLYAQAQDGRLGQLTGVGQDYEPPERAELTLDGDDEADIESLAGDILDALQAVLARHRG